MAGNIKVIEPTDNFQKVSKNILRDLNIRSLSVGIYARILCLGKEWKLNVAGLAKILNLSERKVKDALSELEIAGYIKRIHIQGERGHFAGFDYLVGFEPFPENERTNLSVKHSPKDASSILSKIQPMDNPTDGKSNRRKIQPMEKCEDIYKDLNNNRRLIENKKTENKTTPTPPSLADVTEYCKTRGFADPAGFADYYIAYNNARDWKMKDGKPIQRWKQNILAWENNNKSKIFSSPTNQQSKVHTRKTAAEIYGL